MESYDKHERLADFPILCMNTKTYMHRFISSQWVMLILYPASETQLSLLDNCHLRYRLSARNAILMVKCTSAICSKYQDANFIPFVDITHAIESALGISNRNSNTSMLAIIAPSKNILFVSKYIMDPNVTLSLVQILDAVQQNKGSKETNYFVPIRHSFSTVSSLDASPLPLSQKIRSSPRDDSTFSKMTNYVDSPILPDLQSSLALSPISRVGERHCSAFNTFSRKLTRSYSAPAYGEIHLDELLLDAKSLSAGVIRLDNDNLNSDCFLGKHFLDWIQFYLRSHPSRMNAKQIVAQCIDLNYIISLNTNGSKVFNPEGVYTWSSQDVNIPTIDLSHGQSILNPPLTQVNLPDVNTTKASSWLNDRPAEESTWEARRLRYQSLSDSALNIPLPHDMPELMSEYLKKSHEVSQWGLSPHISSHDRVSFYAKHE